MLPNRGGRCAVQCAVACCSKFIATIVSHFAISRVRRVSITDGNKLEMLVFEWPCMAHCSCRVSWKSRKCFQIYASRSHDRYCLLDLFSGVLKNFIENYVHRNYVQLIFDVLIDIWFQGIYYYNVIAVSWEFSDADVGIYEPSRWMTWFNDGGRLQFI